MDLNEENDRKFILKFKNPSKCSKFTRNPATLSLAPPPKVIAMMINSTSLRPTLSNTKRSSAKTSPNLEDAPTVENADLLMESMSSSLVLLSKPSRRKDAMDFGKKDNAHMASDASSVTTR